uniref:Ig-like domain-containing protein n=1 Tax=Mastacembelus armatus TaxID=205130 RepID=A0A3Q3LCN5_9TELE
MRSFILIKVFLPCSYSWVSVSGSESQTVQVQPGEEVTLLCPNISRSPTHTNWFRLVKRTKPSCVSSVFESKGRTSFCDGFQNGKYEMSSNISPVFLKIKSVDLSDSGLYFCGFYINKHTVIASAVELSVQGETVDFKKTIISILDECDGRINLITVILGCLTVLLTIVIIDLAVKIKRLQTGTRNAEFVAYLLNRGSDDLNYAPLNFRRQLEPNVVYAATR